MKNEEEKLGRENQQNMKILYEMIMIVVMKRKNYILFEPCPGVDSTVCRLKRRRVAKDTELFNLKFPRNSNQLTDDGDCACKKRQTEAMNYQSN